jgi:hypothetical protein
MLKSDSWQPVIALGAPGSGKTYFCTKVLPRIIAECLGCDVSEVAVVPEKPARRDATEMAGMGLPFEDERGWITKHAIAPVLIRIQDAIDAGAKYVILVWDEAAAAALPEQKVLSDSLDPEENKVGHFDLQKGWNDGEGKVFVCGTGNRAKDKAGSINMLAQNTDRALVVTVKRDVVGWAEDYATPNGVNPIMIECALAHADDGFFAEEIPATQEPFNTERSTTMASKHLDAIMAEPQFTGMLTPLDEKMLATNIGWSAARRVSEWIQRRDNVPTGAQIIASPETVMVPPETGFQLLAAQLALAEVNDVRSATAALHYIVRLRKDLRVSLGVKLMNISSKAGWMMTDPLAQSFIMEFNEFLPLTFEQ